MIREELIKRRKSKKYTQQQMADMLSVGRSTYNAYELGTINIPLDKAIQIKKILKYTKDDIFFKKECPRY